MDQEQNKPQQKTTWQQTPGYRPVPSFQGDDKPLKPQQTPQPDPESAWLTAHHQQSAQRYPQLGLSNDEYVILEVRRHPIGLLSIWAIVAVLIIAVFSLLPLYSINISSIAKTFSIPESSLPAAATLTMPFLIIIAFFILGGYIATYVYQRNRFYLTNESVIQHIQTSLFSQHEQHINLANIEDSSYRQDGVIQHLFNYGTLRLSTEGEETTYRFSFVAHPRHVVQEVIEATENATGFAARFRHNAIPHEDSER